MAVATVREKLFQYRGYTPIPFLIAMIWFAQPTKETLAIGGMIAVLGELTRFWGVAYAGRLTRVTGGVGAPEVIVSGPFAYVRNPLYVGNILLYVGIGIMSNALLPWLPLVAAAYFSFQYSTIVSLEEEFLERKFGAAYLEYKKNVPRFFPRFARYGEEAQTDQPAQWNEALHSETRTLQALGVVTLILVVLWYRG